ncbi:MAG: cation:proton antiporter [Ilumatobacteraceae bacterium]|nr:cation:proton antiporter [Ilumatobacteraceae bacterium]MDP4706445.1 cation:proton antiporter [Ilumatobacteraceae bacterium]MDP4713889.1 cation:proton antiporter [Ilumatobacteraceae bacterium]MDP4936790.1 cation:proton antiporter [Ilumatobacteraceae bacterium]MDP4976400.1 cation:proton antiporter [Ilumatobacteraceae bacterium]
MSLLAASTEGYDLALILGNLLIIILVARLAAELAERIKIPAVLGEIVAGIIIGPSVLGLIDPIKHLDVADMVLLLGEIGVILLLFQVGLEMDLGEMAKVGKPAFVVAIIGVAVPFAAGFGVAASFGEDAKVALFIGATLTATSVGITARVLGDLRALALRESRIVLGAAVADDVLGLVILTVVVKVVTEGSISAGVVLETIGLAVGFLLITGLLAIYVIPRLFTRIDRLAKSTTTIVSSAFALTLAFSLLANQAKLAFIIGAFMAGLAVGRSPQHERISEGLNPLGHIFIPVFFASIGINADLEAMFQPSVLVLAVSLTVVAIIGKLVAGLGVGRSGGDKLLIGIAMMPRGEVGLIFASIGLSKGVLDDELYGALLLMVLVTTLITPPLIRLKLAKRDDLATPTSVEVWTSVDTSHLIEELLNNDADEWWRILDRHNVELRIPEIGSAMQRRRTEPDFADQGLNVHLHSLHALKLHLDDPRLDPLLSRALDRVGLIEIVALACFIDSLFDNGHEAIGTATLMMPESTDDIIHILSLSESMKDAVHGPDLSIPAELLVGDAYITLSAYVVAALTVPETHRTALDVAINDLV